MQKLSWTLCCDWPGGALSRAAIRAPRRNRRQVGARRSRALSRRNRQLNCARSMTRRNLPKKPRPQSETCAPAAKTAAEKKSADLSAFAVQIAEDAKDRAVDIPDMVDQALERHTRRFHENRRKTKQAESRRRGRLVVLTAAARPQRSAIPKPAPFAPCHSQSSPRWNLSLIDGTPQLLRRRLLDQK